MNQCKPLLAGLAVINPTLAVSADGRTLLVMARAHARQDNVVGEALSPDGAPCASVTMTWRSDVAHGMAPLVERGRAVQVDPMKSTLKPPGSKPLKLNFG